jgi:hypothetical protein
MYAFRKLEIYINILYPRLNDIIVDALSTILLLFIVGIFRSWTKKDTI